MRKVLMVLMSIVCLAVLLAFFVTVYQCVESSRCERVKAELTRVLDSYVGDDWRDLRQVEGRDGATLSWVLPLFQGENPLTLRTPVGEWLIDADGTTRLRHGDGYLYPWLVWGDPPYQLRRYFPSPSPGI